MFSSSKLTAKLTKFCEMWIKMLFGSKTPEMENFLVAVTFFNYTHVTPTGVDGAGADTS